MSTFSKAVRQRGQTSVVPAATSVRFGFAPQWEQNFAPKNIMPKQDGQAMVASRAPQCSQRVASEDAAAPHMGQFSVSAGIVNSTEY
jgi:hypothetical protein